MVGLNISVLSPHRLYASIDIVDLVLYIDATLVENELEAHSSKYQNENRVVSYDSSSTLVHARKVKRETKFVKSKSKQKRGSKHVRNKKTNTKESKRKYRRKRCLCLPKQRGSKRVRDKKINTKKSKRKSKRKRGPKRTGNKKTNTKKSKRKRKRKRGPKRTRNKKTNTKMSKRRHKRKRGSKKRKCCRNKQGHPVKLEFLEMHVKTNVMFRYAKTVVSKTVKNPSSVSQTTVFKVILPDHAFVSNFSIIKGENQYVGIVKANEEAAHDYNTDSAEALLEKEARDANVFQMKIRVQPYQTTILELTYEEMLTRKLGEYDHVLFVQPGQVVDQLTISVDIDESMPISKLKVIEFKSELDFLDITNDISRCNVYLASSRGSVELKFPQKSQQQGDGIIGTYKIKYDIGESEMNEVQILDDYFVHFFKTDSLPAFPQYTIFVLDISGSMGYLNERSGRSSKCF